MTEKDVLQISLSVISAIIALIALIRTRVSNAKQRKLQVASHVHGYFKTLHEWSDAVIADLTDAAFLCELDPKRLPEGEFFERRRGLRAKLSSLFDRGRLLLPNSDTTLIGLSKHPAYRGLRPPALDRLYEACELLDSIDYQERVPNLPKRQLLIDLKREFVSEMQEALDVRRTAELVRTLANEIRNA